MGTQLQHLSRVASSHCREVYPDLHSLTPPPILILYLSLIPQCSKADGQLNKQRDLFREDTDRAQSSSFPSPCSPRQVDFNQVLNTAASGPLILDKINCVAEKADSSEKTPAAVLQFKISFENVSGTDSAIPDMSKYGDSVRHHDKPTALTAQKEIPHSHM
ncbi:hypothetical protein F2P79_003173 [Pimephales promelas]|nr:hypothetical protein F2P79_003173 [Pimephales promelas]